MENPRLLIFVIAYHAESTLCAVLDRIPESVFDEYECEVLVVDDASQDRTFEIGREYKALHPELRITVLRNEFNQGYGGNQKVGYSFAIREGFDYVAMVHGDGQYAPEELPKLVAPIRAGTADAVFGSRMMTRFGALKGGMPFYKFVGNKVLTTVQNALLGTKLSEFHSGYRVYATAALKKTAFLLNSNDFHFDTEIILQLLSAKLQILELPIPTFYGDEICRVNGMKYAKDVVVSTLRYGAHRSGFLELRKFDALDTEAEDQDERALPALKLGYASSDTYTLEAVPDGARVLDIGSTHPLVEEFSKKSCRVGITDTEAFRTFASLGEETHERDRGGRPWFDLEAYDYLLLVDVIEHLERPEAFLDDLRSNFDWSPKLLVLATPNVAFVVQRLMLLLGQFNYGKAGILARTHRRLFTFRGVAYLLADAGFRIKEVRGIPAPFPKAFGDNAFSRAALWLNERLIQISKPLFSYQIFVVAESTPTVEFVLRDATERSFANERPRVSDVVGILAYERRSDQRASA